jgi:hypothetical protein
MPPLNPALYGNLGRGLAGSQGSVQGNDLRAILNDLIGALDDPELLKSLSDLGINIQGGKDNKNFLNIVPALLGQTASLFNQPTQFTPSFDPIEGAIETEKKGVLGGIDRSIGETVGAGTTELESQGLGPLAIADFVSQQRTRGASIKGEVGQQFAATKQRAKFDFDQMVNQLKQQYDLLKSQNVGQGVADIGQLLSLFLL